MNVRYATWLLLAVGVTVAACVPESKIVAKNSQGNYLKKEIIVGASIPTGCQKIAGSIPAGKKSFTVSYSEPKTSRDGKPLDDLAYTTLYVASPNAKTTAIRVWTNDARGGADVSVSEIPVPGPEVEICVTATDRNKNESAP